MYPVTKTLFSRCFHCISSSSSNHIRCYFPDGPPHCRDFHTLGWRPSVNVQNVCEIQKLCRTYCYYYRCTSCRNFQSHDGFERKLNNNININTNNSSSMTRSRGKPFVPRKMLVLPKVTRFSYEKGRFPDLSEIELRRKLAERGSDYEHLVERHSVHMKNLEDLVNILEQSGGEVKVCEGTKDFTEDDVRRADLVVSAGGDGTFLSASRRVFGDKPIVGVNTDFVGSEGFLCLPRKYSGNFARALESMRAGAFRWKKRARIRVSVKGGDTIRPIDLYDEDLTYSDHRRRHDSERQRCRELRSNGGGGDSGGRVIPIRALNEVFVGESLSSRMSYYEISIDDGPMEKQKSSGITICTGTGSTSCSPSLPDPLAIHALKSSAVDRSFNINKLSYQSVEEVLKLANHLTDSSYPTNKESVKTIADSFNGRLLFDPRVLQMVYTVRDPVVYGIFQVQKPRGFARKITIRSRCKDACLTVDAGTSYLFNDGAIATLEMHDGDAIRTMEMVE